MTQAETAENAQGQRWWRTAKAWWFIAIALGLALLAGVVVEEANKPLPMAYGAFLDQLEADNVASATFQGMEIDGRFKHPLNAAIPTGTARRDSFSTRVPDVGDPTLLPELRHRHAAIDVKSPWQWTSLLAGIPFPILVFVGLMIVGGLVRLVRGGKTQSRSAAPVHPMQGMIETAWGLFTKQQSPSPPTHDGDDAKTS